MKLPGRMASLKAILLAASALFVGSEANADEAYSRTSFYEDGNAVTVIAFSPDGAQIAFAAEDRTVRIRDTATGNETASLAVPSALEGGDDYIHLVTFSPDLTRLVTASRDRMVRLWDIARGEQLAVLEHQAGAVFAVFSPDATRLATASGDTLVSLWDAASGALIANLEHPSRVILGAFSTDGARLVTASPEGTGYIWDVANGSVLSVLQGHMDSILDARFSRDGTRVVTASADTTARIWDAASGHELLVLRHSEPVTVADFSADGRWIVTGAAEAHVFDAADGDEIVVLKGHPDSVTQARFSPDGTRIATGSHDGIVRVWNSTSGEVTALLVGHNYAVNSLAFSADGQQIFTTGGGQGIVWTRIEPGSFSEEVTGLWFNDFGTADEPLPPEIIKSACMASPIKINSDGMIVLFDGGYDVPPHPALHIRCASDLSCQIFAGAPTDGPEPVGTGSLTISGDTGDLCLAGECRTIARCPDITWTDDERSSGFAEQWEAAVLGGVYDAP